MLSDLVFLKCKSLTSAFALMAKSLAGLEAQVLGLGGQVLGLGLVSCGLDYKSV